MENLSTTTVNERLSTSNVRFPCGLRGRSISQNVSGSSVGATNKELKSSPTGKFSGKFIAVEMWLHSGYCVFSGMMLNAI